MGKIRISDLLAILLIAGAVGWQYRDKLLPATFPATPVQSVTTAIPADAMTAAAPLRAVLAGHPTQAAMLAEFFDSAADVLAASDHITSVRTYQQWLAESMQLRFGSDPAWQPVPGLSAVLARIQSGYFGDANVELDKPRSVALLRALSATAKGA